MTALVSHPRFRSLAGLAGFSVVVAAVAVFGSLAASSSSADYQSLRLPPWAPPSWVFGPVWTVLYGSIAIAGWLVWRCHGFSGAKREMALYAGQLVLNAAWTPLFFAADRHDLALVDIVALLALVAVLVVAFHRRHRVAGLMLVPYLAWVAFATALNTAIVILN